MHRRDEDPNEEQRDQYRQHERECEPSGQQGRNDLYAEGDQSGSRNHEDEQNRRAKE
jgi:hypothetical protein